VPYWPARVVPIAPNMSAIESATEAAKRNMVSSNFSEAVLRLALAAPTPLLAWNHLLKLLACTLHRCKTPMHPLSISETLA